MAPEIGSNYYYSNVAPPPVFDLDMMMLDRRRRRRQQQQHQQQHSNTTALAPSDTARPSIVSSSGDVADRPHHHHHHRVVDCNTCLFQPYQVAEGNGSVTTNYKTCRETPRLEDFLGGLRSSSLPLAVSVVPEGARGSLSLTPSPSCYESEYHHHQYSRENGHYQKNHEYDDVGVLFSAVAPGSAVTSGNKTLKSLSGGGQLAAEADSSSTRIEIALKCSTTDSPCYVGSPNEVGRVAAIVKSSAAPPPPPPPPPPPHRTSSYRGVTRHRWTGRYEAHLWDNTCVGEGQKRKGRQVYLGGYDKEEKAAKAYDLAALKYWGATATINFSVSSYSKEIEEMKDMTKQEFIASLRRRSSGFSRGASIFRGVTRHHQHGRWQARIGRVAGNKDLYLGTFSSEEEAAEAYDIAVIKFRGVNAVTNFELNRYDLEAIACSDLPIGSLAKRLKLSNEAELDGQQDIACSAVSLQSRIGVNSLLNNLMFSATYESTGPALDLWSRCYNSSPTNKKHM